MDLNLVGTLMVLRPYHSAYPPLFIKVISILGCAFLQESPEFPRIRRNLGFKNKNYTPFFAGTSRKSQTVTKEPSKTGSFYAVT
jgi:hypothetical protein